MFLQKKKKKTEKKSYIKKKKNCDFSFGATPRVYVQVLLGTLIALATFYNSN